MKVGIYTPYPDTMGGGERYTLTFAEYCLQRGWQVELFWHDPNTITQASQQFNLNLEHLKLNPKMYKRFSKPSHFDKILKRLILPSYDLIFFLSDGSVPFLYAKRNWIHFQVPFQLNGNTFITQQKLSHINRVICNSKFTKKFIDKSFNITSDVVYPPVSVDDFHAPEVHNENIILSVGRFDQIMNSKRQDVLIDSFKQLVDNGLTDWWLILVGGHQHNEAELLKLRELSMGYPIDFHVNVPYEELLSWYHRATFFWHAAGYEVDEQSQPDKVEHFGISVVEAMAAGCIPLIHKSGGLKEIIRDKKSGYFWENKQQLIEQTQSMIKNLSKEQHTVEAAKKRAQKFSKEAFFVALDSML